MTENRLGIQDDIGQDELGDFLITVKTTLAFMTPEQVNEVYLYVSQRRAIAVSFDKDWQPFLGYTRGLNPPDKRTLIRGIGDLLQVIRSKFQKLPHDRAGGRVFLTNDRAYHINKKNMEVTLCRWSGVGNRFRLVDEVIAILRAARAQ